MLARVRRHHALRGGRLWELMDVPVEGAATVLSISFEHFERKRQIPLVSFQVTKITR